MKKFLISILIATSFLVLFSCGSDDDSNSNEASIEGTWKLTSDLINGESDFDPNFCEDQETVVFNSNNTFTSTGYVDNTAGTGCEEVYITSGTYVLSNGQITINFGQTTIGPHNYTLTNTTFTMTIVDGADVEVLTYTRQ